MNRFYKFFNKELRYMKKLLIAIIIKMPFFKLIRLTANTQTPVTFKMLFIQKVLGFNRNVYWPVHHSSKIDAPQNILCGIETCPGYMPGCYISGYGKLYIGDYTQISSNVGIITTNHDYYDNRKVVYKRPTIIGKYCWIGMNSTILPGVELGDFTIVAAGSIVSKSFKKGYCIVGGNPAKLMFSLDPVKCVRYESDNKFNGYISNKKFEEYRKRKLKI